MIYRYLDDLQKSITVRGSSEGRPGLRRTTGSHPHSSPAVPDAKELFSLRQFEVPVVDCSALWVYLFYWWVWLIKSVAVFDTWL